MAEWSFLVQPDITVTVRASRKPVLLARAFGAEIARQGNATLLLDLDARGDRPAASIARGRYKMIPWSCQVSAPQEGRQALAWRSPLFREYLALHIALLPALRRLLLERGIALVVGAACAFRGAAVVLAGNTGSGKTAALLNAAGGGAQLIGDEYVAVSATGEVTPVIRAVALRRGTLAGAPELWRRLGAPRRIALRVAALEARLSGGRLDPLSHVAPSELGLSEAPAGSMRVSTLVWLERAAGSTSEPMNADDAVEALLRVQQTHERAYHDISGLLSPSPAEDTRRWRETLVHGLRDVRCIRVTVRPGPVPRDLLNSIAAMTPSASATKPFP